MGHQHADVLTPRIWFLLSSGLYRRHWIRTSSCCQRRLVGFALRVTTGRELTVSRLTLPRRIVMKLLGSS